MVTKANELARAKLAYELPELWRHAEAAGKEAERIAPAYGADATVLTTAVWLLDIGYAPDLARTGFAPLDAANHLREDGWLARVVDLVATRSAATLEADARGLRGEYAQFSDEASATRDAVWYCHVVGGMDGDRTDLDTRLAQLTNEYGSGGLAGQLAAKARGELAEAVRRTRQRLRAKRMDA